MAAVTHLTKPLTIKELQAKANHIRQDIIRQTAAAASGHPGGALGMADLLTVLYFHTFIQNKANNPKKPQDHNRDRFILSAGHICPVLYATLAHKGYFPHKELLSLRKQGSRLQGHPHRSALPGIETTSGPLGSGLSQAAGMALVFQRTHRNNNNSNHKKSNQSSNNNNHLPRVFVVAGDGEQNEGNHWEAVMFAAKEKLNNLICITDRNHIQIDGNTQDVLPLNNLQKKYESFGWDAITIDGHNYKEIMSALNKAYKRATQKSSTKPLAIIAKTIPGKGVDFMENNYKWHGNPPNQKQAEDALHQLQQ